MINPIKKYKECPVTVKAAFWFLICGFIQRAITLITTPIFTRLLSTSEYGDFNVYQSWHGIILILASLNLASGVYLRGLVKYEDNREEFTGSLQGLFFAIFLTVSLLCSIFMKPLESFLELDMGFIYVMLLDILVATAFHYWSSYQRVEYKYRNLVIVTVINAICKPLAGIICILIFKEYKLEARIFSMVAVDVLTFGKFFLDFFKRPKFLVSTKYWKYALAFNLPLVPHYLSQIVLASSDKIMIKKLIGSSESGIYGLAYSAASVLIILNTAIINTLTPWMYQQIKKKNYGDIKKNTTVILVLVAFANFMLVTLGPEAIRIFAPEDYNDAIWVIPPVAASTYFIFMYSLFANFEFYYEKTKYMMIASVSGALLNLGLNYVFINIYGYYAAGYTTLACYILYCLGHYLLMRRINKKQMGGIKVYSARNILLISLVFVLACGSMLWIYPYTIIRVLILILLILVGILFRKKIIGRGLRN